MMRADVDGSLTGFVPAAVLAGGGVPDPLPLGAASVCALFFFFAIFLSCLVVNAGAGCFVVVTKNRLGASVQTGACVIPP
jgi:hypothetical protein